MFRKTILLTICFLAMLAPLFSFAQTGPMLLSDKCTDPVTAVSDLKLRKIDNGYLRDESCNVVFVKPPTRGDFKLSGIAKSGSLDLCGAYANTRATLESVSKQYLAAVNAGDVNKAVGFVALEDSVFQLLKKYNDVEGITASGLMSAQWNELVQAYSAANPKLQVRAMPLIGSYLTYTAKGADADAVSAALKSLSDPKDQMSALISSKIPGLKPVDLGLSLESPSGDPTLLFGSSLSGQLILNLHGACPYYKGGKITIKDGTEVSSLYPYIVSNVQYFYPVRAQSGYRIQYDADIVADWVSTVITNNGTFSNRQVTDKLFSLQGQTGYKIEIINDDFVKNASATDLAEIKRELTMTFAYSLLNKLADPILQVQNPAPSVVPPNDPYYVVEGTRTECRSINFLGIQIRRDCSNVFYRARQPTDGSAFGKATIKNVVALTSSNSIMNSFFIVQRDTLSFVDQNVGN